MGSVAGLFLSHGYEGTSLDDIVMATGLLRGSLYSAYGSKRGMFLCALKYSIETNASSDQTTDLLLVALLELAPHDRDIRDVVEHVIRAPNSAASPEHLGERLLERAGIAISH